MVWQENGGYTPLGVGFYSCEVKNFITGTLLGFDDFVNVVLEDVTELYVNN